MAKKGGGKYRRYKTDEHGFRHHDFDEHELEQAAQNGWHRNPADARDNPVPRQQPPRLEEAAGDDQE